MTANPGPESMPEVDDLMRLGVKRVLADREFPAAFDSFFARLPQAAPSLVDQIPAESLRPIALTLFREIWNHTPRPDLGWKRQSQPKPERNAPCPCGSGRKYKQCCDTRMGTPPALGEGLSVLGYVLESIPVESYGTIPFRHLDPAEVAHAADEWEKAGRVEEAARLLEALLAPGQKLDLRHESAFDLLCDVYLDAGLDAERMALVERVMRSPDAGLRAVATQRMATLMADRGEYEQAWSLFREAQRLDPDSPMLAHVEVSLLVGQQRFDDARGRAGFWAKRLVKLGYAGEPIVEMMERFASDPQALHEMWNDLDEGMPAEATPEDVAALERLVAELPEMSCLYRLAPQGDSAGPLQPTPELAAIEQAWQAVFPVDDDFPEPWADTRWIGWLRTEPLAWSSFTVLSDLLGVLAAIGLRDDDEDRFVQLEMTLLDRAVTLLRRVIAENAAEGLKIEWGWWENRPALGLLMQRIDFARHAEDELPLLEWLVLTLNPHDNGGHRERLVHALCEAGRAAEAVEVCDRYPDDGLPGILYGRVLALYLLDRPGDAVAALVGAKKNLPKVLRTLLADRPKMPALTPGMTTYGGDDQAWQYRLDCRLSWEKCGALDWLRSVGGR